MSIRLSLICLVLFIFLFIHGAAGWPEGQEAGSRVQAVPDGRITGVEGSQIDAYRISLKGSDGVRFGDTFQIMRSDKVIGEAFVVSQDPNNCIISIKGATSTPVQPGDIIRFVRHKKEPPKVIVSNVLSLGLFRDIPDRADMVQCSKCGVQMQKSFIRNFNDYDHYAMCCRTYHEFLVKKQAAPSPSPGKTGSGAPSSSGSTNAQDILKAPENWTEKVSTTKYEDWGKTVRNPILPTIGGSSGPPVVSGYGTDNGKEVKMQIIQSGSSIKVYSPTKK